MHPINEYLFNLQSTLLSLQQRTEDELRSSNALLKDDIEIFKNNGQEKPTLESVNELWNPIKGKIVSKEYTDLISIQSNSYPIFEEFIKYVVNDYNDISQIIEIISSNLKGLTLFMENKLTDFNFSNKLSINDKMSKLDQEVTIRSDTVKTMNREVKIEELSRLIEERRMMVDSMNSLI